MKSEECEQTILSVMATADGETSLLSIEETARHLQSCQDCALEIKRQKMVADLFESERRCEAEFFHIWSEIENKIETKKIPAEKNSINKKTGYFLPLLVAILIAYKLLEIIPARDLGLSLKFIPVLIVIVMFYFLKENPFKINTELTLEGGKS